MNASSGSSTMKLDPLMSKQGGRDSSAAFKSRGAVAEKRHDVNFQHCKPSTRVMKMATKTSKSHTGKPSRMNKSSNHMYAMVSQGKAHMYQYRGPGFFDADTGELSCTPTVSWQKSFKKPENVLLIIFLF